MFYCGVTLVRGQNETFIIKPKVEVKFDSCQENNSELSILNQYTKQDDLIIVISHLGKDEKESYGQRRLYNAMTFLTKGFNAEYNRTPESILVAEGKRVDEKGYLDFFTKGNLELRIFLGKNRDLRVPPCVLQAPEEKPCSTDFEKLFYPCKK